MNSPYNGERLNEERGPMFEFYALLLIRYCGWHADPKFSPWFEAHRDVMARAVAAATAVVEGRSPAGLMQLRDDVEQILQGAAPEAGEFETAVVDHINLIFEALDFFGAPFDQERSVRVLDHADDLAASAEEMGDEDYRGNWQHVGFAILEVRARTLGARRSSLREALELTQHFSRLYADVIENCYTDEDAGRGR